MALDATSSSQNKPADRNDVIKGMNDKYSWLNTVQR